MYIPKRRSQLTKTEALNRLAVLERAGFVITQKDAVIDLMTVSAVLEHDLVHFLQHAQQHGVSIKVRHPEFYSEARTLDILMRIFDASEVNARRILAHMDTEIGTLTPDHPANPLVTLAEEQVVVGDFETVFTIIPEPGNASWEVRMMPHRILRLNRGNGKLTAPYAYYQAENNGVSVGRYVTRDEAAYEAMTTHCTQILTEAMTLAS